MFERKSIAIAISILVILVILYGLFILRGVRGGPSINVVSGESYHVTDQEKVTYRFELINTSEILFQGKPQRVNEHGELELTIYPHQGINIYVLQALNSFNDSEEYSFSIYKTSQ